MTAFDLPAPDAPASECCRRPRPVAWGWRMRSSVLGLWCRFVGHSWRTIAHDFCSVWYREQFIDCALPVHNETCQQNLPIEVCDRCGAVRRNVSAALGRWPEGRA